MQLPFCSAHASCFKVLHEFFSSAAAGLHYSLRSVEGYCELSVQQIPPPVPRQYYLRAHSEEHFFCFQSHELTLSFSLLRAEKISGAAISGLTAELIAGNSSLNLSCQASAGSISNRLWLKDGQLLSPSNRVTFTADNSSMDIKKVEKDDAGQYKCSLSNPISTATAERNVVVNYGPESVTVQGEKTVKINTKVVLECSASSVPPAGFMWTFNETLTNVKTNTFIIEKANYNDSGDYTCVASNAVTGLKSTSVHTLVSNGGLSGGAVAAIVIVLLLVFAGVGAGIFTMKKKK
uniref:Ig-like domain-containing protein n=1 Tax=Scleropages formosus TaxID=113540 RepID=A0A8C9W2G1_SCLFO